MVVVESALIPDIGWGLDLGVRHPGTRERRLNVPSAAQRFEELYEAHAGSVRGFVLSLVRDPVVADDVMQEVAMVLWRRFNDFNPEHSFGSWARGIAYNKVLKRWRKYSRSPVVISSDAVEGVMAAYDRAEHQITDEEIALETCMEKLPERSREYVELRYVQKLQLNEIAERLDNTLNAVNKALGKIRGKLMDCIRNVLASMPRTDES
jgi:RNA polymerase sigma-70 factor (ECF subfamily)